MKALFTGAELIELERVDSTNNFALKLVQEQKVSEGLVVWAKEQFSGKGQRGNSWHSRAGDNLTFSIVYFPAFIPVDGQFMLSKAISLGLADFAGAVLKMKPKIKWPNDIYVEEKKIAGILIENTVREKQVQCSVIGIGINVNQVDFPAELGHATSMKLFSGKNFELRTHLEKLCSFIEVRYLQLRTGKTDAIEKEYSEKLYRKGEWADFSDEGGKFSGKITGVTKSGRLIVEKEGGSSREYDFKQIQFINSSSP